MTCRLRYKHPGPCSHPLDTDVAELFVAAEDLINSAEYYSAARVARLEAALERIRAR